MGRHFLQTTRLLTGEIPILWYVISSDYQTMRKEIPHICNILTGEIPILGWVFSPHYQTL